LRFARAEFAISRAVGVILDQGVLGHLEVGTAMLYRHVLNQGRAAVRRLADRMPDP